MDKNMAEKSFLSYLLPNNFRIVSSFARHLIGSLFIPRQRLQDMQVDLEPPF